MTNKNIALGRIGVVTVLFLLALAPPSRAQVVDQIFRTRLGGALAFSAPLTGIGAEKDNGSNAEIQIGVGDDPLIVGLVIGYTTFGGIPLQDEIAKASSFELRTDWNPSAPTEFGPTIQIGVALYILQRPDVENDLRFGIRTGLGYRWAPWWHTQFALVGAYNFVPDVHAHTRQWATLGLEVMQWSD